MGARRSERCHTSLVPADAGGRRVERATRHDGCLEGDLGGVERVSEFTALVLGTHPPEVRLSLVTVEL
jgi:hypothetical protein